MKVNASWTYGGLCVRRFYFYLTNKRQDEITRERKYKMGSGLQAEEYIVNKYKKRGEVLKKDVYLERFGYSGRIDLIIKRASEQFVVEIKKTRLSEDDIKRAYSYQINIYMYLSEIHKGIFHVVSENKEKVIGVRFDKDLIRKTNLCRDRSFEAYRTNETPKLEYDINKDFVCRFCNFKGVCSV